MELENSIEPQDETPVSPEHRDRKVLVKKKFTASVILVLVLIGFYFLFFRTRQTPGEVDLNNIVEVSPEEIISDFPLGLPVETGGQARASYRFIPADSSERQSTISYVSGKTFEENSDIFEKFLLDANYDILNEIDETSLRFFYAQKDSTDLLIGIEEKENGVLIDISYLKRSI